MLLSALVAATACRSDKGDDGARIRITAIRCAAGQEPGRPYPSLQYLKVGALCAGQGSNKDKDNSELSVSCHTFTDPDASGKIQVLQGRTEQATGDCIFSLLDGKTRRLTRNAAGAYIVQDFAGAEAVGEPSPLMCHSETYAREEKGSCSGADIALPADGDAEAAILGVQGACVTKDGCREVAGLTTEQLAAEQTSCQAQAGAWRVGTCTLSGQTSYVTGCLKHPAVASAADSTALQWTTTDQACPP